MPTPKRLPKRRQKPLKRKETASKAKLEARESFISGLAHEYLVLTDEISELRARVASLEAKMAEMPAVIEDGVNYNEDALAALVKRVEALEARPPSAYYLPQSMTGNIPYWVNYGHSVCSTGGPAQ